MIGWLRWWISKLSIHASHESQKQFYCKTDPNTNNTIVETHYYLFLTSVV